MALYTAALVRVLQIMKSNGFKGKSFCMMGKQYLNINLNNIVDILRQMNLAPSRSGWESVVREEGIKSNSFQFFSLYDLKEVHAMDFSDYEGADIICDMREDIPKELHERFDYVLDGGVTEHVFDPAKTISNMSQLVKPNGIIIHILPAVGYVDHGFYSFSPTFFRDFYGCNGFDIENLDMDFLTADGDWNLDNYADHVVIMTPDLRLFHNVAEDWSKRRLNEYIKMIYSLKAVGHSHLWCVARKRESLPVRYPTQEDYSAVEPDEQKGDDCKYDRRLTTIDTYRARDISKMLRFLIDNGKDKEIVLFGAGYCGIRVKMWLDCLGLPASAFCDNNAEKRGLIIEGLSVISPEELKKKKDKVIPVITSNLYAKEIEKQIKDMGYGEDSYCILKTEH